MKRYVPYEKLGKKQKRELDGKRRVLWTQSPVTRKAKNEKIYSRKKVRRTEEDRFTEPFFVGIRSGRSPAARRDSAA